MDNVPVLALDQMAYVYSPAQSFLASRPNELQLDGVAEFPQNVIENSHVTVDGRVSQAGSSSQHTRVRDGCDHAFARYYKPLDPTEEELR